MSEYSFSCFSTRCVIKLEASENIASSLARQCFELCKKLHLKYNFFDTSSLVSKINSRNTQRIKLDPESASILARVDELAKITQHNFDITLINKKLANGAKFGANAYTLSKRHIEFADSTTQIDLGGVIKEYAIDCCAELCKAHKFVLNFGGDIRTNKCINVNLKNPQKPTESIFKTELNAAALTTSALYERAGHIVNTSEFRYAQASVIGANALSCGAFSTCLLFADFALPQDFKAILIDFNNQIHFKNF